MFFKSCFPVQKYKIFIILITKLLIIVTCINKNAFVINAKKSLDNARINRNKILYFDATSIYNTQLDAKNMLNPYLEQQAPNIN